MGKNLVLFLILVIGFLAVFAIFGRQLSINLNKSSPTPTGRQTPKILFPAGNEILNRGQKYLLRWDPQNQGKITIFLINTALESKGESVSISDRTVNIDDNGSFVYMIPANTEIGTYKFTIGKLTSNVFQIVDAHGDQIGNCIPADLQGAISLEGAAGSTYGTLGIKNTSSKTCKIIGSNFVKATYSETNVKVEQQGDTGMQVINLAPGQTIYSETRFPNGAQCSSAQTSKISFSYEISPNQKVIFHDSNGNTDLNYTVCKSNSEITTIDVWSTMSKPAGS